MFYGFDGLVTVDLSFFVCAYQWRDEQMFSAISIVL